MGWLYVAVLYGVFVGAAAGLLAAAVLLAVVAAVVAARAQALRWRGWPWLAGLLVAVAVLVALNRTESISTQFVSLDMVVAVTAAALGGLATAWRTRAVMRRIPDRMGPVPAGSRGTSSA